MKVAKVGGNPWSRTLAMVHVAMSDAINSVQNRYTRYITTVPAAPGASAEAAAAAAARQILLQLFPAQKTMIEDAYANSLKADSRWSSEESRHCAGRAGRRRGAGGPRVRRHQRARHLPADHQPGCLGADDAADFCAIRPRKAVGADQRRSVPARPAAAIVERALRPRLQRDEDCRRGQEHDANGRADRGGEVLDPSRISARLGKPLRANSRRRRNLALPKMHACSRCSTSASPTPSSPTGTPNSRTTSGDRSPRFATPTWTATTPPSVTRLDAAE